MSDNDFMQQALEQAKLAEEAGEVPIGAVLVYQDKIIATGYNQPITQQDPTAHAEIVAINEASKFIGNFWLIDCELYTTCEPCPMCLGAIYWARIKKVYYATNREDAALAGFDDSFIYQELFKRFDERKIPMIEMKSLREEATLPFSKWNNCSEKTMY